jgi:hypothetical protein
MYRRPLAGVFEFDSVATTIKPRASRTRCDGWRAGACGAFGHGMPCPYWGNFKGAGETPAVREATSTARSRALALTAARADSPEAVRWAARLAAAVAAHRAAEARPALALLAAAASGVG